jgi:hypothetical protein
MKTVELNYISFILLLMPTTLWGQVDKTIIDHSVTNKFSKSEISKLEKKVDPGYELQSTSAKRYIDRALVVLAELPLQINQKKANLQVARTSCADETNPDQKTIKCDHSAVTVLELSIIVDYFESILQSVVGFHGVLCSSLTTSDSLEFKNYCQASFYQPNTTWNETYIGTNNMVQLNAIENNLQQMQVQLGWLKTVNTATGKTTYKILGDLISADTTQVTVTVLNGSHNWTQSASLALSATSSGVSQPVLTLVSAAPGALPVSVASLMPPSARSPASTPDAVIRNGELIGVQSADLFSSNSRQYVNMHKSGMTLREP